MKNLVPPGLLAQYEHVQAKLLPFINSHESFQLLALVALFSPWTESGVLPRFPASLLTVRDRYLVAMERRNAQPVADILRAVGNIEMLADLFQMVIQGGQT
jgi:hypothetical protein